MFSITHVDTNIRRFLNIKIDFFRCTAYSHLTIRNLTQTQIKCRVLLYMNFEKISGQVYGNDRVVFSEWVPSDPMMKW